jgi:hypothetical protein
MVNHISYQSNQSYHNNQVMYSSNRSRTESGSSESSRGSGNSGNSDNNSGNSGRSRRRSHRPRGCRGGSNRRRHNSGEGRNKQQLYNKTTYNNDFKSRVQGKFSRPSMNHNGPPEEELLVTNGQQYCDPNSFRRPSYNNHNNATKDFNYRLPEYTFPSGISVSSQSDFHHSGIACSRNSNSHYYRDTPEAYNVEPENNYPMLQSSFSESSSSSEIIFEEHDVAYAQSQQQQQQQQQDQGHGQILPPLPSNALFHHPKQIPFGPNPYALKTSGSSISNSTTISSSNNIFTTPSPVIERSETRQSAISVVDTTMNLPGILQRSNNNHIEFDYRAQRLEKQRQNVVGGSLFVTSPRSFLMSCKKSFNQ